MWYTESELKKLRATLRKIEKCNGDCKHCDKLDFVSNGTYYAYGCKHAPNFSPISNTMRELRDILVEQLKFELEV